VCLPCEVILEWIKLYKVHRKLWGLSGSLISFQPSSLVWNGEDACVRGGGDMKTPSVGGEAP
jgi:hypothetical protein